MQESRKPDRARTNRKLACENRKFFVYFDEIGSTTDRETDYLVVAPKQACQSFVTGVAVLPICDEKIALLRIYRHAIEQESWEIPRGFIEQNETPLDSALRELAEETGLICGRDQVKPLGFVTPDAGILAARVQMYAALQCVRKESYQPAEMGHEQLAFFDVEEVKQRIVSSEIQDPCTAVAFYRYVAQTQF